MADGIAFLGSTDTVKGFTPLGVSTYPATNRESALQALRGCLQEGFAIVCVTEEIALLLEQELKALRFEPTPAILVVPSMTGSTGLGLRRLKTLVEKAVGADILSREGPAHEGAGTGMGE
ncbi:MAG: V-type ATP synthase subunit F [Candidatus Eisenbacteria bacterium]|jgi:V/A-type H+-transporting ATPase subunit F|nr:V-type ATP synthase subunit F [Candidatus Eisenbacteria bacterium]